MSEKLKHEIFLKNKTWIKRENIYSSKLLEYVDQIITCYSL